MARRDFNNKNREDLNARFISAIKRGELERARTLLDNGANINARDEHGETALLWAVKNGQQGSALMLLAKKASLETQDNTGSTPLLHATRQAQETGDTRLVSSLLEAGADINAENAAGETPIQLALKSGNLKLVELYTTPMKQILDRIPVSGETAPVASRDNGALSASFARFVMPVSEGSLAQAHSVQQPQPLLRQKSPTN